MQCKKIQTLLLSDYNARTLTPQRKAEIETHLKSCPVCGEFAQTLKKVVIDPFKKAEQKQPPVYLWSRIRETIEAKPQPQSRTIFDTLKDFLSEFIPAPRPALALTLTILVIISIVLLRQLPFDSQKIANIYIEDQAESLLYLSEGNGVDFGTGIEEYFL